MDKGDYHLRKLQIARITAFMVLKLTVQVRNGISFSYNPTKIDEILIFGPFFFETFNFALHMFYYNSVILRGSAVLITSLLRHT